MVADGSYFVTMRLKGSLPVSVIEEISREMEQPRQLGARDEHINRRRRLFLSMEEALDGTRAGPTHLRSPEIARIVMDAFAWLEHTKGWLIHALTILSNHVHVVLHNSSGRNHHLNRDLGLLKGFTARQANQVLGSTGQAFWMDENFDHWCRTDAYVIKAVRYTAMNPVRAGLVAEWQQWPWTRVHPDYMRYVEQESAKNG